MPIFCEDCGHTLGSFADLKAKMAAAVLSKKSG
jgi:hypothetical protein